MNSQISRHFMCHAHAASLDRPICCWICFCDKSMLHQYIICNISLTGKLLPSKIEPVLIKYSTRCSLLSPMRRLQIHTYPSSLSFVGLKFIGFPHSLQDILSRSNLFWIHHWIMPSSLLKTCSRNISYVVKFTVLSIFPSFFHGRRLNKLIQFPCLSRSVCKRILFWPRVFWFNPFCSFCSRHDRLTIWTNLCKSILIVNLQMVIKALVWIKVGWAKAVDPLIKCAKAKVPCSLLKGHVAYLETTIDVLVTAS